jgi:hypothetical protein
MPQAKVCFDRIESTVLKFIGAQFLHDTNASAFLMLIEQYPCTFIRDRAQGQMELIVAVTSQRVECVPGCALGMNAHHRGRTVEIT